VELVEEAGIETDTTGPESDTTLTVGLEDVISLRLEESRSSYLSAIESEQKGDTVAAEAFFEAAIGYLNELSEYPEIESNSDFRELSESIVEDYEEHIQPDG